MKERGRKKSIYRTGGFWNGWGQLRVNQQADFIKTFRNEFGVTLERFQNVRKYGTKNKSQTVVIWLMFHHFGVTENIFENKDYRPDSFLVEKYSKLKEQ